MSQFLPRSCLFVYESLIITTAKNILVLNEQTHEPSSPYTPFAPRPPTLSSHLTYFPVQKECLLERKTEILLLPPTPLPIPPPRHPHRSNLLFVNAGLTPEPLGVRGIPPMSDCNTCSVWEKLFTAKPRPVSPRWVSSTCVKTESRVEQWRVRKYVYINMYLNISKYFKNEDKNELADEKLNKYAHAKNKNQKYGTE